MHERLSPAGVIVLAVSNSVEYIQMIAFLYSNEHLLCVYFGGHYLDPPLILRVVS
jgi:hypothetical protein